MSEQKRGYCTLCRSRCGTINTVEGDSLLRVAPDPAHPTGAAICMKGRAAPELVHSPNRILHPMRRTTPKGSDDPGWRRISWHDAIATVAARLATIRSESGPEAVAFGVTTPSGSPMSDSIMWVERFINAFQSPNVCYGTEVCNWHKDHAHAFTFGCGMPTADYSRSEVILLWGHNPTSTWLAQADAIGRGRKRGARLIVVDPRPIPLAAEADAWLRVRPGTDMVVALGIVRLMLRHRAFDMDFLLNWTNAAFLVREDDGTLLRAEDCIGGTGHVAWQDGPMLPRHDAAPALAGRFEVGLVAGGTVACRPVCDHLAEACEQFTPQEVQRIAGVDPAALEKAAELLGSSRRVAYHSWTGIGQHANATQSERALAILYALTGSFDRRGGNRIYRQLPVRTLNGAEMMPPEQTAKALGIDERPLGPPRNGWITARDLYRAVNEAKPYRVRAFFGFGTNMLASQGDTDAALAAFGNLDFHVHCDLFETPTARFADILLPVSTPWEREGLRAGFEIAEDAAAHVQLRPRMVSPRGEARSDAEIVMAIASAMGWQDRFFGGDIEAGWDWMLGPLGVTVADLRAAPGGLQLPLEQNTRKYAQSVRGRPKGFATPSGRVEIYSETLLRHGYDPLPRFAKPTGDPAHPYSLTSMKSGYYCHSQQRSIVSLRKRHPLPIAQIAPALAQERGIEEGDRVLIDTSRGTVGFMANIVPQMEHGVIAAEFGWWQACNEMGRPETGITANGRGSSFNALVTAKLSDPISGSVPMRSTPCNLRRDPDADVRLRRWQGFRPFAIAAIEPEGEGVVRIALRPSDGGPLPDYLPGQHITLRLPGDGLTRAYSLTGPAVLRDRRYYHIAVRHQIGQDAAGRRVEGRMSARLNTLSRTGDRVEVGAPNGHFILPLHLDQPVVLLAAGIGITPFVGYLETLARQPATPEVWLFAANRDSRAHPFAARLDALRQALPRLRLQSHYSRPLPEDVLGGGIAPGRLTADAVPQHLLDARARFFMCGSERMMDDLRAGLIERGVPRFDMFQEAFVSPPQTAAIGDASHSVTFARSGKAGVTWTPASGTLLDLGESCAVGLPAGCRVGQCESCAVRVLKGQVRHLNGRAPEEPDVCLACQAVPISDVVLDA